MQPEALSHCLGPSAHPAQLGDDLCRFCGSMIEGTILGPYRVQQLLGGGRSGMAYLTLHLGQMQAAVVKLFPPDSACTLWQPQTRPVKSRSLDESAPGSRDPYFLILCQYAPGSLAQFFESLRADGSSETAHLARLLSLIQQAGSALATAHAHNLVHGALVPGNLLSDGQSHLWVADFGLARLHPPPAPYLAPELAQAVSRDKQAGSRTAFWKAVTPASDQYMFALLCHQLLAQVLRLEKYQMALPILQRAMQPKPASRFASIEIFTTELIGQLSRSVIPGWDIGEQKKDVSPTPRQESAPPSRRGAANVSRGPASSLFPTNADEWEKFGGKLFAARDYEAALQAYQRGLDLEANKASLWLSFGDACFASERYSEALAAYERAVALNPNDPLAWSNRGTALDALGRHNEAMACYARASQLGP